MSTTQQQQKHINKQGEIFRESYENPKFFEVEEIPEVIDEYIKNEPLVKSKKFSMYNIACSFDIETTSFTIDDKEYATMYMWQLCINGAIIIGRKWNDLKFVLNFIADELRLGFNKRIRFYVHNLAFEFQWIQHLFAWQDIFATDKHSPLKCLTVNGIEFCCSYRLSGYSLKKVGENLLKYKAYKEDGEEFDYSKKRHFKTELTEDELRYAYMDVIVVCCFIQEEIERNDMRITNIPLTSTGYARRLCREFCFGKTKNSKKIYQDFMKSFTMEEEEYEWLRNAFQGGFTHANAKYSCTYEALQDVASFDFSSSYPAVIVSEMYPMGKGEKVEVESIDEIYELSKKYCVVFPITLVGLRTKCEADHPLSLSKCYGVVNANVDNGRIESADEITTYITNIDLEVYNEFYEWDEEYVKEVYIYKKAYLPRGFIEAVAYLYKAKTTLKGVKGKEEEYQHGKALLNALYGMMCQKILNDIIEYDDTILWTKEEDDVERQLKEYNESDYRFTHYAWGVFVTAYARKNLLLSIKEIGKDDYIYSDTDSMKIFNYENHLDYINWYNENITKKVKLMLKFYGLDENTFEPETIKGVKKPIGVWDFEEVYSNFKTLGAKRYMVTHGDVLSFTVSGINKFKAIPYLLSKNDIKFEVDDKNGECHIENFEDEETQQKIFRVFTQFTSDMEIPAQYSGKTLHKYLDEEFEVELVDYMGQKEVVKEHGAIWVGNSNYKLKISDMYELYLEDMFERAIDRFCEEKRKAI